MRGIGLVCAFVSALGCGGRSDRPDGALTGGTAASGAASGGTSQGGTSSGGTSSGGAASGGVTVTPMGGMDARGGRQSFGGVGSAGAPGLGGNASVPECEADEDCEIAKDCCDCHAVPRGTSSGVCRLGCGGSNACELAGLKTTAHCNYGRCTLAASCRPEQAMCESLPPSCPAGQTPTVSNGCWGPCVTSTECAGVADCTACGDAHCVKFPTLGLTTIRCVPRNAECEKGNLCQCLSPCGDYGCGELDDHIGCFCAGC